MAGYGGGLKQLSIGYASSAGKSLIHTSGKSSTQMVGGEQNGFIESIATATANPSEQDIHYIGILASTDPAALDKACLDLIYAAEGNESFVRRVEAQNGAYVIEAAEQIGLSSSTYELVSIR